MKDAKNFWLKDRSATELPVIRGERIDMTIERNGGFLEFRTGSGALFYDVRLRDFLNPKAEAAWWRHWRGKRFWTGAMPAIRKIVREYREEIIRAYRRAKA
jgi:hypothetical protein